MLALQGDSLRLSACQREYQRKIWAALRKREAALRRLVVDVMEAMKPVLLEVRLECL
jgi:hypothetical protein